VLSVGRVSGSAGPQFNNCARGPFCGPRDPEGSTELWSLPRPAEGLNTNNNKIIYINIYINSYQYVFDKLF